MMIYSNCDLLAGVWLFIAWFGYAKFARWKAVRCKCLLTATRFYQYNWMRQITEREVRIADATAMGTMERMISFFAATTILLLGGLLSLLFTRSEEAIQMLSNIPFFIRPAIWVWEAKILALLFIFIYAFFKFSWALRQLGFAIMMVGGSPLPKQPEAERKAFAENSARVFYLGMNAFNYGLRAYYFAMGALAWFVHPLLLLASTLWVVYVLYKREFQSKVLMAMVHDIEY